MQKSEYDFESIRERLKDDYIIVPAIAIRLWGIILAVAVALVLPTTLIGSCQAAARAAKQVAVDAANDISKTTAEQAEITARLTAEEVARTTAEEVAERTAQSTAESIALATASRFARTVAEDAARSTAYEVGTHVGELEARRVSADVARKAAESEARSVAGEVAQEIIEGELEKAGRQESLRSLGEVRQTAGDLLDEITAISDHVQDLDVVKLNRADDELRRSIEALRGPRIVGAGFVDRDGGAFTDARRGVTYPTAVGRTFRVQRASTGVYNVFFEPAFESIPIVLTVSTEGVQGRDVNVHEVYTNRCVIHVRDFVAHNSIDGRFAFVVISDE